MNNYIGRKLRGKGKHPRSVQDRFWEKVNVRGMEECWEWGAGLNSKGYGQFWLDGKGCMAHRFSWKLANGQIPEGIKVLHKCDNPLCVNPDHLFIGTQKDNMQDMAKKYRGNFRSKVVPLKSKTYIKDYSGLPRGEERWGHKLTNVIVVEIRRLFIEESISQSNLGRMYSISKATIGDIINNKSWRHLL